jgi:hypothetical protein
MIIEHNLLYLTRIFFRSLDISQEFHSSVSQVSSNDNNSNSNPPTILRSGDNNRVIKENISVQAEETKPCPSCGARGEMNHATRSYVYALGRIQPRFPSPSIEREYRQVLPQVEDTAGKTDAEAMRLTLEKPQNRYIVRKMCWVLTIEGIDTYILKPRDSSDFDVLVKEALRPSPRPTDRDEVVGVRGPIASPEECNGLMVPIVVVDRFYNFNVDELVNELVKSTQRPQGVEEDQFRSTTEELFYRIMQMADNVGATDEHRALNYEAVRDPQIYPHTAEMHNRNFSLSSIEVRPSRLGGTRTIVDVIYSYRNRNTNVEEKYFVRVDVTEEFPFLVTGLSPFYER